jgi:phosphatidylserine/phosphatidylglycerophosphate/cardiolipin synthase-like enzyme
MTRSLMVLPEDSAETLLSAIGQAGRLLRIKMFVFSDPRLLHAVIAARKRGVDVRVILNPARRSGESENDESGTLLRKGGVEVMDGNPAFDLTHEKSMVVDDRLAYVMSLNWQSKNLTETRDYAVSTSHQHEVSEIIECFDADWARTAFTPGDHSHLIWCVGNGRQRLGKMIDGAKHSIWLQNERYQDQTMIEHLVRAARRGVRLHIMAPPPHKLKKDKLIEGVSGLRILEDVGAKVHRLTHLKLHAKMLLADGARAVIGSINLAPGSFDSRRELAIEVDDPHVVDRLDHVVQTDWEKSRRIDLSDKALLSELSQYDEDVAEDLALRDSSSGEKKKTSNG